MPSARRLSVGVFWTASRCSLCGCEALAQTRSERQRLKPELDAAIKSASAVQVQVQAEVRNSQALALQRVEELESVLAQRQAAELAEAEVLDAQKAQDLEAERRIEQAEEEAQRGLERKLKKRFKAS